MVARRCNFKDIQFLKIYIIITTIVFVEWVMCFYDQYWKILPKRKGPVKEMLSKKNNEEIKENKIKKI